MTTFERTATDTGLTYVEMLSKFYSSAWSDDGLSAVSDAITMAYSKWRYMDDTVLTVTDSLFIPWVHQRLVDQGADVHDIFGWVRYTGPFVGARIWARGRDGYSDLVR